jgi:hypothetical protein
MFWRQKKLSFCAGHNFKVTWCLRGAAAAGIRLLLLLLVTADHVLVEVLYPEQLLALGTGHRPVGFQIFFDLDCI